MSRKTILDIKTPFLNLNPFSGVNSGNRWKFCDVISPKNRKATGLKSCIRHAFMTHLKAHFNRLMVTLIFGVRAYDPPLGQAND